MPQFRNPLWRAVDLQYKLMEKEAPEGYKTVVKCFLHGEPEPVVPSLVESHREHPWIVIHVYDEQGKEDERAYPGDKLIFTTEANIARVVLGYDEKDPTKRSIGFGVGVFQEDEPPDEG